MKINIKKSLKFVTLLLSSLLISFVSAEAYSELFMKGMPITIGSATVKFVAGDDTTNLGGEDAINTAGTIVTFDLITIKPGEVLTYNEAVNITNNAGSAKNITITLDSLTGDFQTNFDYINITIIAGNSTTLGSIKVFPEGEETNNTEVGPLTMLNGETWAVQWSLKADTNATESQSINIVLKVKVE